MSSRHANESPDEAAEDAPLSSHLTVLGLAVSADGQAALAVKAAGAPDDSAQTLPLSLLIKGRRTLMEDWMLRNGHHRLALAVPVDRQQDVLRGAAQREKRVVLSTNGYHEVQTTDGFRSRCLVRFAQAYWLDTQVPPLPVTLIGQAGPIANQSAKGSLDPGLAKVLETNPRLLAVVLFALAAMVKGVFDEDIPNLGLIGGSSLGKSTAQRVASWLTLGRDELVTLNATTLGLNDFLAGKIHQPVFVEDAHGADAGQPLIAAIMNTANGAARLVSSRSPSHAATGPITSTLIFSAERSAAETARASKQPLNAGVQARLLEVGMGRHGVFDELGDHDGGGTLSRQIALTAMASRGVMAHTLLQLLAGQLEKARAIWATRRPKLRKRLAKRAEVVDIDPINGRLLDGLTFVAFIGTAVCRRKSIRIDSDAVIHAVGDLFAEHISNSGTTSTPVAQRALDDVRYCIQSSPNRFAPLADAHSRLGSGLLGYRRTKGNETQFLFFPAAFEGQFFDEYGKEIYEFLRSAGHLRCQGGRFNRMTVRMPNSDQRQEFVVVADTIFSSAPPAKAAKDD
jgi:hypothetical protein